MMLRCPCGGVDIKSRSGVRRRVAVLQGGCVCISWRVPYGLHDTPSVRVTHTRGLGGTQTVGPLTHSQRLVSINLNVQPHASGLFDMCLDRRPKVAKIVHGASRRPAPA